MIVLNSSKAALDLLESLSEIYPNRLCPLFGKDLWYSIRFDLSGSLSMLVVTIFGATNLVY
ncbi:hypothetical protein AG1IA_06344 [Rhizoctonia solani AG-1 IA]|uniref:Uncharacterized protein n=1 Tax=Thanatephorus cucumeris (strain AG1-IA) TaxID=983506 RepID=L8WNR0_THACA|nr:hypothetical protein AG1IA_06344 [Rhizoctonia solani AG-1 IA]